MDELELNRKTNLRNIFWSKGKAMLLRFHCPPKWPMLVNPDMKKFYPSSNLQLDNSLKVSS